MQAIILSFAFTVVSYGKTPRGITLVMDFDKGSFVYNEKPTVEGKDYKSWKQELLKELDKSDLTFFDWLENVAYRANYGLVQPNLSVRPNILLYPYNFLRELLGLVPASSIYGIDRTWLKEVITEVELDLLIKEKGVEIPTAMQKKLVDEGVRLAGLQEEVRALSTTKSFAGEAVTKPLKSYIIMCKTPDLDSRLYTLYHEIGHIVHGDTRDVDMQGFLNEPLVKSDQKDIKDYLELGIHTLPSFGHTKIGKILVEALAEPEAQRVLKRYGFLWIPPEGEKNKLLSLYERTTEQRADLFALRQLLKLGEMSAILNFITILLSEEEDEKPSIITIGLSDRHPSHVERALYIIGFLIAHEFNIATLINAWEQKGICQSGEVVKNYAYLFIPPSQIRQQIEKAYAVWNMKRLA